MTNKRIFRPAWMVAAATGLLLAALNALGPIPAAGSDSRSSEPAADGAAVSDTGSDDGKRYRRLSTQRLRHSLRMPFFSFQPLG